MVSAEATWDAKFVPKIEISDPPVIGWPDAKLAPFMIPPLEIAG
jgi:hypothetical protein